MNGVGTSILDNISMMQIFDLATNYFRKQFKSLTLVLKVVPSSAAFRRLNFKDNLNDETLR